MGLRLAPLGLCAIWERLFQQMGGTQDKKACLMMGQGELVMSSLRLLSGERLRLDIAEGIEEGALEIAADFHGGVVGGGLFVEDGAAGLGHFGATQAGPASDADVVE